MVQDSKEPVRPITFRELRSQTDFLSRGRQVRLLQRWGIFVPESGLFVKATEVVPR